MDIYKLLKQDHAAMKAIFKDLEETSEQWGAKLKVLRVNVEHHFEEEERALIIGS